MEKGYFAVLHLPQDGSSWGVTFPDLPGCVSGGADYDDALAKAEEALAGHVAALLADGDPVPPARRFEELVDDAEFRADIFGGEAVHAFVRLHEPAPPVVRVNVSLPDLLLRQIDRAASQDGLTRSGFLAEAARARLRGAA